MNLTTRQMVLMCGACILAGWLFAGTARAPEPEPAPQPRPAIRWIARIARGLLWMALVAEPPPAEASQFVHAHGAGDDALRFREGW
jgi:hypothetical protein